LNIARAPATADTIQNFAQRVATADVMERKPFTRVQVIARDGALPSNKGAREECSFPGILDPTTSNPATP